MIIESGDENEFFSVEKFDRLLKINYRIKQIPFFAHFYTNKFFFLWKKCSKKSRMLQITDKISTPISQIYWPIFSQMMVEISHIVPIRFIGPPSNKPL